MLLKLIKIFSFFIFPFCIGTKTENDGLNNDTPKCISSINDISKQIPGKWESSSEIVFPEMYASSSNDSEWLKNACPSQSRVFSCDYRDLERGKKIRNRVYKPDSCELSPFNPLKLLDKLRNRKLVLCCDSVSQQFFSTLLCSTVQYSKGIIKTEFADLS